MKINSGTISMDSGRFYTSNMQTGRSGTSSRIGSGNAYIMGSFNSTYMHFSTSTGNNSDRQYDTFTPSVNDDENLQYLGSDLYSSFYKGPNGITSIRQSVQDFHMQLIQQIEELMERIKAQLLGQAYSPKSTGNSSGIIDLTTSGSRPGTLWSRQVSTTTYSETETTTFNTTGSVVTADGRNIDFNLSLEMSRAFMETTSVISEGTQYILTDPLVLNLDDAPETIGDQKWFFDLDGDGTAEEISNLAKGNAFLALDRDGNGIIDNGKELFGATTGNGFAELAEFDEDGNGWIDENDSIYDKLKVWRKDASGNDSLVSLAAADVGAIYLGSAATQFSHNSLDTNDTLAMVRQSGFFLHESTGQAGLMQQIDFASKKAAS